MTIVPSPQHLRRVPGEVSRYISDRHGVANFAAEGHLREKGLPRVVIGGRR